MDTSKTNILGVGCDFQLESENNIYRKYAIENLSGGEQKKIDWMLNNMEKNKAFTFASSNKKESEKKKLLIELKENYINYRKKWNIQPKNFFENDDPARELKKKKLELLCLDIEVASVCDLACSFCYRQYIATPDKIMSKDFAFKLIDDAADLGVPSIKFNWRGEPLLNPQLPLIIEYAKKKGILETIINTNATKLDEKTSENIIKSGLDLMIYSFDGGTKEIYEKMRPGRFEKNTFEKIFKNISNFSAIRKKLNSPFPRTKIQMILTDETRKGQEEYFRIFKDIVDDVSVKQYTERGGNLIDLDKKFEKLIKNRKNDLIKKYGKQANILKDSKNNIYVSNGRLPCEQPFQRVLTTYDGKAGMCCYDWGATHTIGYLNKLGIVNGDKEYKLVLQKAKKKKRGFELMSLKLPTKYNLPEKKVQTLKQVWHGKHINKVRVAHVKNQVNKIDICKKCPFKETYKWEKIN